jgi:hypothetical protein
MERKIMAEQKPAWQAIEDLFARHGMASPPTRLRDELVSHLVAHREQRQSGFGPFHGYAVLNTARKGLVFDQGEEQAFVWDDQAAAEEHCREGEADTVRRVCVTILPE